jgi:hypothetical protein
LCDLPKSRLQAICKENGIKNYRKFATWSLVSSWVVKEMQSQPVTEGGSPICFLLLEKETKTE